jgi:phospholipid/cholesterol/gamma-HCH transport system ATP-binding protein
LDKENQNPRPVVRIKNVCKSYGDKVVHSGVNLEIKQGEILTLMGGSGSGKSVLLRSIIGLDKPDSGEILFHDTDVTNLTERQLIPVRKKIAYVFQYGALFDSATVKDNLAYPLREHTSLTEKEIHEKVLATLNQLGLQGTENLLPSNLSGGMQRRVGVARSIIMEPEIILYDEPTTGLDPYNTKQILRIIKQLQSRGVTSVLITHDMHSIFAVTDRVAFLREGKIRAIGTAEEIKQSTDQVLKSFISGETM